MKKLLLGLLLLVIVLVGVAVALPFLLPREMIKAELERRFAAELGREVRIEGPLELRPWRPFQLTLADVSIANPDWASEPTLARIERLDLEVDALAYLGGTVVLERLAIERPTLALEVRADGTPSWHFAGASDADRDASEPDTSGGGGTGGAGDARPDGMPTIRIGDIRLTEGTVDFRDHATGEARSFTGLELWARGEADGRALNLDGSVTSAGERATLNAVIGDLNGFLAGEPSSLTLDVAAPGLGIAANGEASPSGSAVLAMTADSAPRLLLDWLGQPVDLPDGRLEEVTFTVDMAAAPTGLALRAFTLAFDDLVFQGELELRLADRPVLTGRLDLGELDLRPYLPEAPPAPSPGTGEASPAAETPASEAPEAPAGWPDEPLALPLPLPVDLELAVTFASLAAHDLRLGAAAANLTADARATRAEITALELYDGRMTGQVTLTNGASTGLEATAEIIGVQLQPLLAAVADIDRFAGTGNLQFAVTSRGESVDALIRGLDGDGQIVARDGAILGINIGATIRQVMTLGRESAATEPRQTDFAEAGGSFTIQGGVLRNDDFALRAPALRVTGEGAVDLGNQTLAYRLVPRVAATLEGQDAASDDAFQAGVPLLVQGPWENPAIRLDLGTTLSGDIGDPAMLTEAVRRIAGDPELVDDLRTALGIDPDTPLGTILQGVGGLLEGIGGMFGGRIVPPAPTPTPAPADDGPTDEAPPAAEPAPDPTRSLLEGLGGLLRR